MFSEQEMDKIFQLHPTIKNRLSSREGSRVEFKENFNWNSKDRYAKSIAAFANNKGGFIVFGVKDSPKELIGLQNENFESLDESKITEYLNGVYSPEVEFEKFTLSLSGKLVGVIRVIKSANKPVIAIKSDGVIKEAEIYYRYNARSEKIKFPELQDILNDFRLRERESWMQHFERISKIGPSQAAILDTVKGQIEGLKGTLIIDKKLIPKLKFIQQGSFNESGKPVLRLIGDVKPVLVSVDQGKKYISTSVRVTSNPDAQEVRIAEDNLLKEYNLTAKDLAEECRSRYSNFVQNKKYLKVKKQLKADPQYCVTRFLNPKNPKSSRQDFYHPCILKELDKHYTLKKKT